MPTRSPHLDVTEIQLKRNNVMREVEADVVVVGGGPSGLTLAAEVAAGGHRVVVVERRANVVESRAGTILPRVLELFDSRGVADRFIQAARRIRHWPFNPFHIWAGLQPVEWRHLDSRYGYTMFIPQNFTEEVLEKWAGEKGAEVRMAHDVRSVEVTKEGIAVRAVGPDGENLRIRAQYLVGADGARSTIRKSLNLPFEGHGATFSGIIADVVMDWPFAAGIKMVDNHLGWSTCFPFGERIVRFSIVHAERRRAERNDPFEANEVETCIRDIYGDGLAIERVAWASRFTDQMRIVPNLQLGRAFLVGEAARIHYPASGVGMNFCVQDAFNLGWKLSYVLSGHAPAELLSTYDAERRPVALELLSSVREQSELQFKFNEEGIAHKRNFERHVLPNPEVNQRIGRELNGIQTPYPRPADAHPFVGLPVRDIDLVLLDGTVTRLAELLHDQKFLLLDMSGSRALQALADRWPSLKVVEAKGLRLSGEEEKLKALLVRPDAYVAWAEQLELKPEKAAAAYMNAVSAR